MSEPPTEDLEKTIETALKTPVTRRSFLRGVAGLAGLAAGTACGIKPAEKETRPGEPTPTAKESAPTPTPTETPKISPELGRLLKRIDQISEVLFSNEFPHYLNQKTGRWEITRGEAWTEGFWPGLLWQAYAQTREEKYLRLAEKYTEAISSPSGVVANLGKNRDRSHESGMLGIIGSYSSVLGYEITGEQKYYQQALAIANLLRDQVYDPQSKTLHSSINERRAIVDDLMSLQPLWWAYEKTKDPSYKEAALNTALQTADLFLRPDGSVYHAVWFDKEGNVLRKGEPGQGFGDESVWSRGQSWALYGLTVAFEKSGDPRLLEAARKVADFIGGNLSSAKVPYYDYKDPNIPDKYVYYDSSAGAIAAAALFKLAKLESLGVNAQRYFNLGSEMRQALTSDAFFGPEGGLKHGCYGYDQIKHDTPAKDTELIFGDYFLMETLIAS